MAQNKTPNDDEPTETTGTVGELLTLRDRLALETTNISPSELDEGDEVVYHGGLNPVRSVVTSTTDDTATLDPGDGTSAQVRGGVSTRIDGDGDR